MQTKWYIRSLFVVLILLGIGLEQNPAPNQQIVVAFEGTSISSTATKKAIDDVKEKLAATGAKNIQVKVLDNGTLTITYYSPFEAIVIKGMLSSQDGIAVGYTPYDSTPNENKVPSEFSSVYKLDVHELKQYSDVDVDLNGIAFEFEPAIHRYFIPDVSGVHAQILLVERNKTEAVAFKINNHQSLGIDQFSYKIPEVRAGPRA